MRQASDSKAATYAPEKLREAQQTLNQAERVWENESDRTEVSHLAYVAEQQARIAEATAQRGTAEAEARLLAEERDRVQLSARTRAAEAAQQRAQEAATQAQQLEKELAELNARNTERGLVMTLESTFFDYNSSALKPGAMNKLSPLITFLREHPERNVTIEGYTDSLGSESYNLDLSQRRA